MNLPCLENTETKPIPGKFILPSKKPLLRGLLFDEHERGFTPSFCCKGKKRYHYYILTADRAGKYQAGHQSDNVGLSIRLPAKQVEDLVADSIQNSFDCEDKISRWFSDLNVSELLCLKIKSAELVQSIKQDRHYIRQFISKIKLGEDALSICLDRDSIASALLLKVERFCNNELELIVPFTKRRRGNETKLTTQCPNSCPDKTLIQTLAASHRWLKMLNQNLTIDEIAKREKRSSTYIRTRLHFSLLSPKIQTAIINGRQPTELTADKLARMTIPIKWDEQERVLGFCS